LASRTALPWVFSLDIHKLATGSHRVEAVANDRAGNVGRSAPMTFTK
jgi:hypothetical protein